MTKVYIVQAEHPTDPFRPLTAHATKEGAIAEAIGFLALMPGAPKATAENWQDVLTKLQNKYHPNECDVWITEVELERGAVDEKAVERARAAYPGPDVELDADPLTIDAVGGVWVSAWVRMATED